jgi:hypothetical protein
MGLRTRQETDDRAEVVANQGLLCRGGLPVGKDQ